MKEIILNKGETFFIDDDIKVRIFRIHPTSQKVIIGVHDEQGRHISRRQNISHEYSFYCSKCDVFYERRRLICSCGKYYPLSCSMPLIIDDIPFKTILPAIEKLTPKRGCNVLQIKQHSLRISLKHQIFVRDKACLHCGLEITKWAIFQGRKRNRSKIIPVNDDYVPFTIDHIIPKSKGGISDNSNYQTLCYDCNIKKDDKLEFTCPLNYQTLCYDCNIKKDDKLEFTSPLPEVQ